MTEQLRAHDRNHQTNRADHGIRGANDAQRIQPSPKCQRDLRNAASGGNVCRHNFDIERRTRWKMIARRDEKTVEFRVNKITAGDLLAFFMLAVECLPKQNISVVGHRDNL